MTFENAYRLTVGSEWDPHILKEAQFLDSERYGLGARIQDMVDRLTASRANLMEGSLTEPFDFIDVLGTQKIFWVHQSRLSSFHGAIRRKHGAKTLRLVCKAVRDD